MLDEMLGAFDHQFWVIHHLQNDVGWSLIETKNKFCFQMLDGMLDAFDRFTSSNISPNTLFVGMRTTLYEVDILSSDRHFRSIPAVCPLNNQFLFLVCFTDIFNQSKLIAAQAKNDHEFC